MIDKINWHRNWITVYFITLEYIVFIEYNNKIQIAKYKTIHNLLLAHTKIINIQLLRIFLNCYWVKYN